MTRSGANLIESIIAEADVWTHLRRDLRSHPEIAFQEQRTADLVAQRLASWGIPVERGLGKTGLVGMVRRVAANARSAYGLTWMLCR